MTIVESPVLSNGHAGFGERRGETDRSQSRNRAPRRLYNAKTHQGWVWSVEPTTGETRWSAPTGHHYTTVEG
jgi:hypothetical protein